LDLSLIAIILIQAEGRYIIDVEEELARLDGIISIYEITGKYNIAAIAKFKEEAILDNFIKNILKLSHKGKPEIVINVVRNVIKEDFGVNI
jgi:Lrp/AsnC family transcriptional regulator for asnA, asnC and gidA